jgi:hypothetical protein
MNSQVVQRRRRNGKTVQHVHWKTDNVSMHDFTKNKSESTTYTSFLSLRIRPLHRHAVPSEEAETKNSPSTAAAVTGAL